MSQFWGAATEIRLNFQPEEELHHGGMVFVMPEGLSQLGRLRKMQLAFEDGLSTTSAMWCGWVLSPCTQLQQDLELPPGCSLS